MDPALDPPHVASQAAVVIPTAAAATSNANANANFTSVETGAHNHPPYAEMISAAIGALNERDGSSKRAIAKYIETQYSDLPPTHSSLLTQHLKRLKTNGQLLLVKHSYNLPGTRSAPASVNGAVNVESASAAAKRWPGRPPKLKPDAVQAAVPVFHPPINMNDVPAPFFPAESQPAVNGVTVVRGRGRPPKRGGPGRPRGSSGGGRRGRPRKNAATIAAPAAVIGTGKRPRGRPPNPLNMVEGGANLGGGIAGAPAPPVVTGKRRGRPSKAGNEAKRPRNMNAVVAKPPRKLSGKPLGRPRKNAQGMGNRTQDSQLLLAYLDLKAKLQNLQSMVKQTTALVRPSLNSEAAINAMQELELAVVNASAVPNAELQS